MSDIVAATDAEPYSFNPEDAAVALARSGARQLLPEIRRRADPSLRGSARAEHYVQALIILQDRESLPALRRFIESQSVDADVLDDLRRWREPSLGIALLKGLRTGCFLPKTQTYCTPFAREALQVARDILPDSTRNFVKEALGRDSATIDVELRRALASEPEPNSSEEAVRRDSALVNFNTIEAIGAGDVRYRNLVQHALAEERATPRWAARLSRLVMAADRLGMRVDTAVVLEAAENTPYLQEDFINRFGPFALEWRLLTLREALGKQPATREIGRLYVECGTEQVRRIRPYLQRTNDGLALVVPAHLSRPKASALLQDLGSLFQAAQRQINTRYGGGPSPEAPSDAETALRELSAMFADRMESNVRQAENQWTAADIVALSQVAASLRTAGFAKEASSVDGVRERVVARATTLQRIAAVAGVIGLWFASWVLALAVYPHSKTVRTALLSPALLRRIWAAGFVDVVLVRSPWIGRRLLRPWREQLLSSAVVDPVDSASYFAELWVRPVLDRSAKRTPLWDACTAVTRPTILEGPSGCGKSLFLKMLATKLTDEIVCYLPASECRDGVFEAVARRFGVETVDVRLIGLLVREGGLLLLIDGLNEVSPTTTRSQIFDVMTRYKSGRILATTQLLADDPPSSLQHFRLVALDRSDAARLVHLKLSVLCDETEEPNRLTSAVDHFLSEVERTPGGSGEADEWRFYNPLDLTLAAELIASGEIPSPMHLIEQQYNRAARRLTRVGKEFSKGELAESVWKRFLSGDRTLDETTFRLEVTALHEQKMAVARQVVLAPTESADDPPVQTFYEFRHQRILEYFLSVHLATLSDDEILAVSCREELKGAVLLLCDALPLGRVTQLEAAITRRELETRQIVIAAQFRKRLEARRAHEIPGGPTGT